jgi:hypothetical protein
MNIIQYEIINEIDFIRKIIMWNNWNENQYKNNMRRRITFTRWFSSSSSSMCRSRSWFIHWTTHTILMMKMKMFVKFYWITNHTCNSNRMKMNEISSQWQFKELAIDEMRILRNIYSCLIVVVLILIVLLNRDIKQVKIWWRRNNNKKWWYMISSIIQMISKMKKKIIINRWKDKMITLNGRIIQQI